MHSGNALTEQAVLEKSKASSLSEVKSITFWGADIQDVSIVSKMPNLESVSLSANKISSLQPFASCPNLKEIFLRRNHVANLSEFDYLKGLSQLRVLWFSDNPVASVEGYRDYIIRTLPQVIKLDEEDIIPEQRAKAKASEPVKKSKPRLLNLSPANHQSNATVQIAFLNASVELVQLLSTNQLNTLESEIVKLLDTKQ